MKRFAVVAVLAACAPPPPIVSPADADRMHVAIGELQRGRDLLIAKCGGCHDVPVPDAQTHAEWPPRLDDMAQRAGLVGPERHLIEQYVLGMDRR